MIKFSKLFFWWLVLGFWGGSLMGASAEVIETMTTLRDLGFTRVERLRGMAVQKDYFFPLPVRNLAARPPIVRFRISASRLLHPASSVALRVNETDLVEVFLRQDRETMLLEAELTPEVLTGLAAENFLKISLVANLVPPEGQGRCSAVASGTLWIEVHPDSSLRCFFDNRDPDWLAIARLSFTLRENVTFTTVGEMNLQRQDLLLKAASWIGYIAPMSKVLAGRPEVEFLRSGEPMDEFVFLPSTSEGASVRIEPAGRNRKIYLTGSTREECLALWMALRQINRHRVPGARWEQLFETGRTLLPNRVSSVFVEQLAPDFVGFNQGIGGLSRSFRFDLALFGQRPREVLFRLKGLHRQIHRPGSATLRVAQNDRLIFTKDLPVDATDFDLMVPLDARTLRGQNEVRVTIDFTPDEGECKSPMFFFFWQLDPACSLLFEGEAPRVDPADLLQAAQSFFARTRYDVIVHKAADLPAALQLVLWLQKVNSSALLEPWLVEQVLPFRPVLAVGDFPAEIPGIPATQLDVPVVRVAESLRFVSSGGQDFFQVAAGTSGGMLQLGYRGLGQPVLWASGWGLAGEEALRRLAAEMAELPWFGEADILLGDGVAPMLAMSSSDVQLREVHDRHAVFNRLAWMRWRWWIVGGVWLLLTGVVIWIFSQSRRHSQL